MAATKPHTQKPATASSFRLTSLLRSSLRIVLTIKINVVCFFPHFQVEQIAKNNWICWSNSSKCEVVWLLVSSSFFFLPCCPSLVFSCCCVSSSFLCFFFLSIIIFFLLQHRYYNANSIVNSNSIFFSTRIYFIVVYWYYGGNKKIQINNWQARRLLVLLCTYLVH